MIYIATLLSLAVPAVQVTDSPMARRRRRAACGRAPPPAAAAAARRAGAVLRRAHDRHRLRRADRTGAGEVRRPNDRAVAAGFRPLRVHPGSSAFTAVVEISSPSQDRSDGPN